MSTFGDGFKSIVGTLAPTIASAIGGPFAGAAVSALVNALGLDPKTDQAKLESQVMAADPADLAKIKEAEIQFQQTLAQLGVAKEQLAYADTASARSREAAVKDRTPMFLAAGVTVGFFGVLGFMITNGKPLIGGDALLVMLGSLGTAWANVMGYYFGSSAGSDLKTQLLSKAGPVKEQ